MLQKWARRQLELRTLGAVQRGGCGVEQRPVGWRPMEHCTRWMQDGIHRGWSVNQPVSEVRRTWLDKHGYTGMKGKLEPLPRRCGLVVRLRV